MTRTLANALSRGRAAGLDHVRLAAALAVVVSHAWPLSLGPGAAEPLSALFGVSLGHCAVIVFFFLSGLLVTRSAEARSAAAFWRARMLRIAPGLIAALCVTLALAIASGARPDPTEATAYLLRGLSLIGLEHRITGAFAANPYPLAVNGPLWTLVYEVACYALVAALVASRLLRRVAHWGGLLLGAATLVAVAHAGALSTSSIGYRLNVAAPLLFAFLAGSVAWQMRDTLRLCARRAALFLAGTMLVAALLPGTALADLALTLGLGYGALVLGLRADARPLGADLSYGVYVLGWPVAQGLVAAFGPMSPVTLALASAVAVLPLAALSWHLVEKPALGLRLSRAARIGA